ncbi:MAG: hypothetical protein RLY93_15630 [Sumerlaeia bacterium]
MSDHRDRIQDLLDQAADLEPGPAKVALLEEAVALADASHDDEMGFRSRDALVDATSWGGLFPEKMLTAFSWMLALFDEKPDARYIQPWNLLWIYKWIGGRITDFPEVSREQVEGLFADMDRRYREHGFNLRPVWKLRCQAALDMESVEDARRLRQQWVSAPQDYMNDCRACELNSHVSYFLDTGEWDEALRVAEPLLNRKESCRSVPHSTYGNVLIPLLRQGDAQRAMDCHRRGYPMIQRNSSFVATASKHMTFCALTDNRARALRLFERHLPLALTSTNQDVKFTFYRNAAYTFDRLARVRKKSAVKLRVAEDALPVPRNDQGEAELEAVRDFFLAEARRIAKRFDARNGNTGYSAKLDHLREWDEYAVEIPYATKADD